MRRYRKFFPSKQHVLILAIGLLWQACAWAFSPFTIHSIKAEGLQRLDLGTVLTYLPLSVGDQVDNTTAAQAIRALYKSGLFQNVELLRSGSTLIVKVKERPEIADFSLTGATRLGGKKLVKALKKQGLGKGDLFKRSLLEQLMQEIRHEYYANGYYDVDIRKQVEQLPHNRVSISIKVGQGSRATIQEISIVGNTVFSDETLLSQMKLTTPNWWDPFQTSDEYSRHVLSGDIERLTNYYENRGYLEFDIPSVQVALTPDMKHVYITINVDEGHLYKVANYHFSGNTILNEHYLKRLVTTHSGKTFSRKQAMDSANRIESALSDIGYAFAKVTPEPSINHKRHTVAIVYNVQPGHRVYVRHITFSGYGNTEDSAFRREMRQLEAAPFSKSEIERSRVRLQRLPYVEGVKVNTTPVPGSKDEVDVNYAIKPRQPGSIQFGLGYSGYSGFLINAAIQNTNFLGTGNNVGLQVATSQINRMANLNWTDPYFTESGISQTINLNYEHEKGVILNTAEYNTNTLGGSLTYGIPLSEYSTFDLGGGVSRTNLTTFPGFSSTQVNQFVAQNGSGYTEYELKMGIVHDTRNRTIFASTGTLDKLSVNFYLPVSTLNYYTATFTHQQYFSLPLKLFIEFNGILGYTNSYGSTTGVPPYANFYGGGPGSVRGFKSGYLDPKDSNGYPYGGTFETTAQTTLVLPIPDISNNITTRTGVFFDIGNVFAKPGDFSYNQLRQSVGLSFQWFTPIIGLLDLSLAYPIHRLPGDNVQYFQFSFGSQF